MLGLMQDWPLTIDKIITHAKRTHPWREVITRGVEGDIRRTNYGAIYDQARRVSASLVRRGICLGDRIGTLAWNTERHMEAWYGIAGIGAVYHTINPRLFPQQIAWITNHAEDRLVFADLTFVPLLEAIQDQMPTVEAFVLLTTEANMPVTKLRGAISYEAFLAESDGAPAPESGEISTRIPPVDFATPRAQRATLKGVLYSHRSNVLLTLFASVAFTVGTDGAILAVVPMFHANAWALTFIAPILGVKLVLPGPRLDGASLYELMEKEQVTWTAAVPTLWQSLLQYTEDNRLKLSSLKQVLIGGSATPPSLARNFAAQHGVEIVPAWGMTETSPIGTLGGVLPEDEKLDAEQSFLPPAYGQAAIFLALKCVLLTIKAMSCREMGLRSAGCWSKGRRSLKPTSNPTRKFWMTRAFSIPATSAPSTNGTRWPLRTARRTSSNRAGNGFHLSISKTSRSDIQLPPFVQ